MLSNTAFQPAFSAANFVEPSDILVNKKSAEFSAWLTNEDKICTDGADDGRISAKEAIKSFGKGVFGIIKTAINNPVKTLAATGIGLTLSVATGGAILPAFVTLGIATGIYKIGYGAYKAATAKLDGETKKAWEAIGNGTFSTTLALLGSKSALNSAAKAGVKGASNIHDLNTLQRISKCYSVSPEVLKTSIANIKGNLLTWTTGTIHANSNALRKEQVPYMSKANEVKAYRFNPNGTEAEILENNPGVFKTDDGSYCIPNKWNPESPHLINTSKEQMIMMYGPEDMAVCDGDIFQGSYVDTVNFKSNNSLAYQDPSTLEYGKIIDATKQAPGAFKIVPVGTKVQTLEGPQTVQNGQAIAIDHAGNPYVTSISNILKRNNPLPGFKQPFEQLAQLSDS